MLNNPRWFAGALTCACAFAPHVASAEPLAADVVARGAAPTGRAHFEGASDGAEVRDGAGAASFVPVTADARLPARFELRTAAEALRFVLPDGTRVDVAPHSLLSRLGPVDVALSGAGVVAADHLNLAAGEIRVEVPPTSRAGTTLLSSHGVQVLALPRTVLRARVRTAKDASHGALPSALAIAVYEGEARFLTQRAWKPVLAAQVVEAVGNERAPAPSPLVGSPLWPAEGRCIEASATRPAGDCSLALAVGHDSAPLTLEWAAMPGAAAYQLEVAREPDFRDVLEARETTATGATVPLAVGRYFARVSARGVEHLLGRPGPTRELRVVRVDMPAGTRTADGAWRLPQGRKVAIGDPAGLELGLGRVGFCTAPADFGLSAEVPVRAKLRITGAPDFRELDLQPSTLRATVSASPRNPVWPFDTVAVDVRIDDLAGPLDPSFSPRLLVEINASPVPVSWSRHGDHWLATLPDRAPPGPWVVHVEARDGDDNLLGDGFTEVSGPKQRFAARR